MKLLSVLLACIIVGLALPAAAQTAPFAYDIEVTVCLSDMPQPTPDPAYQPLCRSVFNPRMEAGAKVYADDGYVLDMVVDSTDANGAILRLNQSVVGPQQQPVTRIVCPAGQTAAFDLVLPQAKLRYQVKVYPPNPEPLQITLPYGAIRVERAIRSMWTKESAAAPPHIIQSSLGRGQLLSARPLLLNDSDRLYVFVEAADGDSITLRTSYPVFVGQRGQAQRGTQVVVKKGQPADIELEVFDVEIRYTFTAVD